MLKALWIIYSRTSTLTERRWAGISVLAERAGASYAGCSVVFRRCFDCADMSTVAGGLAQMPLRVHAAKFGPIMTPTACAYCAKTSMEIVGLRNGLRYGCCTCCGHCDQLDISVPSDAFRDAQSKYFGEASQLFENGSGPFEEEVQQMRARVVSRFLTTSSSVLEVGPGAGAFTKWLARSGHKVSAVEHSAALARSLVERNGIEVHVGEFEICTIAPQSQDAFFSFHVIEHVIDPFAHLRKGFECVRPGGWAFVATPNARSWEQRLFRRLSPNFDSAHLRVFSPDSLRRTCEITGWEVFRVYAPEYTSGWLRVVTKTIRRLKGEDEEKTAGKYAVNVSKGVSALLQLAGLITFPMRALQSFAYGGNELFFVLRKPSVIDG